MQKYMIKIILTGILFSTLSSADQIVSREGDIVTVIASGEYIMGDSDNRKEARTMALTQAKTNASEVAGTYIESNFESVTKQTNGTTVDKVTKQELRSFSAAILQSEITNDTMEMLANKTTVYKVSIKARIDLATLRERVKQLGEDNAKKDRLMGLEKENKDLSSALEKLSGQMRTLENSKSVKPEEIRELREARDRLFTKLEKNEAATKVVFEKGSVLNEYQQKIADVDEAIDYIQNTFIKSLSKYASISIAKPRFINKYGTDKLQIDWAVSINEENLIAIFDYIEVREIGWEGFQKKRFYDNFRYLLSKNEIFITLSGINYGVFEMFSSDEYEFVSRNTCRLSDRYDLSMRAIKGQQCFYGSDDRHIIGTNFFKLGTIELEASEELLSKISEVNIEVVYSNYPYSVLGTDGQDHGITSIDFNYNQNPYHKGDRITSINGIPIKNTMDYFKIVKNIEPETLVDVGVMRKGKKIILKRVVQ